jgi:uncharacterized membrane protein YfcA
MTLFVVSIAFGVGVGVLSGALGVGGGFLIVPYLVLVAGIEQHTAQGTSLVVVLPTAVVATIALHFRGLAEIRLGLLIGVLGAAGSFAGSRLALALPAHTLKIIFAVLLAGVAIRMLVDGLRMGRAPVSEEP